MQPNDFPVFPVAFLIGVIGRKKVGSLAEVHP
jgi:hypothetical protein